MPKISELLQDGDVWFSLRDKKKFLTWAKEQGCTWQNGKEIDPEGDCLFHMAVHTDKTIANVAMQVWFAGQFEGKRKYVFEEYLNGRLLKAEDTAVCMPV